MMLKLKMFRSFLCNKYMQMSFGYVLLLLAFSGAILTLSFAPFNMIFVVPLSFLLFMQCIMRYRASGIKKIFFIGFVYGMGHCTTSLYWIANALLVEPDKFAWLVPFACTLIPSLISFFIGIFAVVMARFSGNNRTAQCISFASLWIVVEFIRSNLILPFPWNLIGYSAASFLSFMQLASIIGVYGVGFIVVLVAISPYSKNNMFIVALVGCVILCCVYGNHRMNSVKGDEATVPMIKIRIVQPNFQFLSYNDQQKQHFMLWKIIDMSNAAGYQDRDIIISSEASYPLLIDLKNAEFLKIFRAKIKSKAPLIIGGDRYERLIDDQYKVYNSIFNIDHNGAVQDFYDKQILVPFGEYIPLQKYVPFLDKIANGESSFSSGDVANKVMRVSALGSFLPMICFEGVFDSLYNNRINQNLLFLLNITNDFWFQGTIGPYQHFTMTTIRAIEYGIPLIRVANTGISAVIDCYGRILRRGSMDCELVLDVDLMLNSAHSVYSKNNLRLIVILAVLCVLIFSMIYSRK